MTEKERPEAPEQPENKPADCFDAPPVTVRQLIMQTDADVTRYGQRSIAE